MSAALPLLLMLLVGDTAAGAGATEGSVDSDVGAPLTFRFLGCPDELARDVEELVRADVAWAPGDPPVALTVRCDDARVTLLLAGDDGGLEPSDAGAKRSDGGPEPGDVGVKRRLDLATTPPEARARTAALIATELILMGRKSPPPVLPVRRATMAPAGDEAVARASAPPLGQGGQGNRGGKESASRTDGHHPALLAVFGSSLNGVAADVPMFTAGARGRLRAARAFDVATDVVALYQRRTSPYGTSQALGGELSLVGEARLGFDHGSARVGLGLHAVGMRVAGSQHADAVTLRSGWGSSFGPMMRLAFEGAGAHAVGELALEGGWCGPDVVGTAAGGSPIGVGGWWAGVSVAAGWRSGVD